MNVSTAVDQISGSHLIQAFVKIDGLLKGTMANPLVTDQSECGSRVDYFQ